MASELTNWIMGLAFLAVWLLAGKILIRHTDEPSQTPASRQRLR